VYIVAHLHCIIFCKGCVSLLLKYAAVVTRVLKSQYLKEFKKLSIDCQIIVGQVELCYTFISGFIVIGQPFCGAWIGGWGKATTESFLYISDQVERLSWRTGVVRSGEGLENSDFW
jgi:hypothetical protein